MSQTAIEIVREKKFNIYHVFDRLIPYLYKKHDGPRYLMGKLFYAVENGEEFNKDTLLKVISKGLFNSKRENGFMKDDVREYVERILKEELDM